MQDKEIVGRSRVYSCHTVIFSSSFSSLFFILFLTIFWKYRAYSSLNRKGKRENVLMYTAARQRYLLFLLSFLLPFFVPLKIPRKHWLSAIIRTVNPAYICESGFISSTAARCPFFFVSFFVLFYSSSWTYMRKRGYDDMRSWQLYLNLPFFFLFFRSF